MASRQHRARDGSRRDSGFTALSLGFFAVAWFSWGGAEAPSGLSASLTVASAVALVVAALGAIRAFRGPRTEGALEDRAALEDRSARRRFNIIVGVEFPLIGLGAAVLGATDAPAYIPVWICAVVGLHFFPLVSVLGNPGLRWLGATITAVATAARLVGVFTTVPPSSVTGAGAGLALLAFAALALARPSVAGGMPGK